MCGIVGFIDRKRDLGQDLCAVAEQMANAIVHRGPDSSGVWADHSVGIAFGHRRLAILDLSVTGHQPMSSAEGRYILVYNGEIYNHHELRKELCGFGHEFKGTSDTEVMLACLSQWGIQAALKRCVGMFSFALWDRREHTLYLARDRMGEKPLYYGWCGDVFLFGSELKALRQHPKWETDIDRDVLALYFQYTYIPTPYSIYKGIFKLLPGSFLRLKIDDAVPGFCPDPVVYWSLYEVAESGARNPFQGSHEEAVSQLELLLGEAVAGQMIADVPVGAFLSGGVDSSTIVSLMQARNNKQIKTFTIGFEDISYDESPYAKKVASHLNTDHCEVILSPKDAMEAIACLPTLYDEPFGDPSQIPTLLVSQVARRSVAVSLSGDGGDELFCGYNRHRHLYSLWRRMKSVPKSISKGLAGLLEVIPAFWIDWFLRKRKFGVLSDQIQKVADILRLDQPEQMYHMLISSWRDPLSVVLHSSELNTLLSRTEGVPELSSIVDRLLYIESMTSLPDKMLVKLDRAAMSVGLESRLPILDHRVVEFSWTLPLSMKLHNGVGKWVLRQVLYKYVPRRIIERPKSGFAVPIDEWLKGPLRDWAEALLDESKLRREGYLNPFPVRQKFREHMCSCRTWHAQLWTVLMFEAWLATQG